MLLRSVSSWGRVSAGSSAGGFLSLHFVCLHPSCQPCSKGLPGHWGWVQVLPRCSAAPAQLRGSQEVLFILKNQFKR